MKVIKRNGEIVPYNFSKIEKAITSAFKAVTKEDPTSEFYNFLDDVQLTIEECFSETDTLEVEIIQDIIEHELMSFGYFEVAKAFILYRDKHATMRETETRKLFESIINVEKNDVTRDNANMNADTPAGMMMKFSAETTKPFVDKYILSGEIKNAVDNNYIHIHDKDYYLTKSFTCLQHPLNRIFKSGFRIGHGEARAPKRIETAAMLAVISLESVQNEMHGGQAIPAFDFYMAPYVRTTYIEEINKIKDFLNEGDEEYWERLRNWDIIDYVIENLPANCVPNSFSHERIVQSAINNTVKRVHQAMESFIHNCNTIHSRGGEMIASLCSNA